MSRLNYGRFPSVIFAGFVARAVETLDRVRQRGGDHTTDEGKAIASSDPIAQKSAAETAAKLGVSQAIVERTRAVLASDDEDTKAALRSGETTVNAAYRTVKQAESARQDSAPTGEPLILSVQPTLDKSAMSERS